MKTIYSDRECESWSYPHCSFVSDLGTCKATPRSDVNSCPVLDDEGDYWYFPDWCPLKKGPVVVQFQGDNEIVTMLGEAVEAGFDHGLAAGTGNDFTPYTDETKKNLAELIIKEHLEK